MPDIEAIVQAAPIRVEISGAQGPGGSTTWNSLTGTIDVIPFTTTNGGPVNVGELGWNQTDETLDIALDHGVMLQIGEEVLYHVENNTGVLIADGTPCMYAGTVGNSGKLRVKPWDGTNVSLFMGLATCDIVDGDHGYVTHFGKVRGIQTNGANYGQTWASGNTVYAYVGSANLTNVQPTAGVSYVELGIIISAHASNGTVMISQRVSRTKVSADITDATSDGFTNPAKVLKTDAGGRVAVSEIIVGKTASLAAPAMVMYDGGTDGFRVIVTTPTLTGLRLIQWPDKAGTIALTSDIANRSIEIQLAASDETTALTVGDGKVVFRAPCAFLLTGVRASVTTAPTGSTLQVQIRNAGNDVLSTKLSIDASEKTSTTAATPAVINTAYDDFADDAEIHIDLDQIGSTIAGAGLKITLLGTRA